MNTKEIRIKFAERLDKKEPKSDSSPISLVQSKTVSYLNHNDSEYKKPKGFEPNVFFFVLGFVLQTGGRRAFKYKPKPLNFLNQK